MEVVPSGESFSIVENCFLICFVTYIVQIIIDIVQKANNHQLNNV